MASMEVSAAPEEEAVFEGVAESRQTLAFHNTTDASIQEPEPRQVATLMPGEQGPSKSLQVYQGDTVRLKVNARYETSPQQVQGLEGIATEVAGAVEKTASGLESSGASEGLNGLGATGALANNQQEAPQAYLNYLLYDEDYQLIDQGFVAVSEAAAVGKNNPEAAPEELALEVPIEEDGFVYAYLSNGVANSSTPVHFDDFTVEQQSYIVAVHDLYPFGLTFQQPLAQPLKNPFIYNGIERIADLGLNVDMARYRTYDPATGRFWQIDPKASERESPYVSMGNNPLLYADPLGDTIRYGKFMIANFWTDTHMGRDISGFGEAVADFFSVTLPEIVTYGSDGPAMSSAEERSLRKNDPNVPDIQIDLGEMNEIIQVTDRSMIKNKKSMGDLTVERNTGQNQRQTTGTTASEKVSSSTTGATQDALNSSGESLDIDTTFNIYGKFWNDPFTGERRGIFHNNPSFSPVDTPTYNYKKKEWE